MEILITPTHATVYDDYGKNFAVWKLTDLGPSKVWALIDAVRRGSREAVEALAEGAEE